MGNEEDDGKDTAHGQYQAPTLLRRTPGISVFCDGFGIVAYDVNPDGSLTRVNTAPVRGMWMMSGVLYAVVGNSLFKVSNTGIVTNLGGYISGKGRVHMSDNGYCLVIIIPNTNIGYTYDVGSNTVKQITDPIFLTLGAKNLGYIDSYIVFLAMNGKEFYNCESQVVSGSGPIVFAGGTEFPREFGTDPFVGMAIDHRAIVMFGQLSSEIFYDAGNTVGSPFSSAPNNYMEIGCINGETIAKQDQTIFWVANDRTVRKKDNSTPIRVSNHAIESILETADLSDAYALTYSLGGHLYYCLTMPAMKRTLVYDCTSEQWHEQGTLETGYWRPFCTINAYGYQLVGDSLNGAIGKLDTTVFTEFGDPKVVQWTFQPIYSNHDRVRHQRFEMVMGTGEGTVTGQGVNPKITLEISDDGGNTFRAMPLKSLGALGHRQTRAVWWRLGMSRQRVYRVTVSDPVQAWIVDAQVEVLMAKH